MVDRRCGVKSFKVVDDCDVVQCSPSNSFIRLTVVDAGVELWIKRDDSTILVTDIDSRSCVTTINATASRHTNQFPLNLVVVVVIFCTRLFRSGVLFQFSWKNRAPF